MNKQNSSYSAALFLLALIAPLFYSSHVNARPDVPVNVTGALSGNTANLEWNTVEGADGYNIYINGAYVATALENRYVATIDANEVYDFYVTAFSKNPTEFSGRSEILTLPESAIPSDLTIPPSIPTGLSGSIDGSSVSINWEASTDDEAVAGYNVYRNDQYLTTVFETSFEDSVVAGENYTFSVTAFDTRVNFSRRSDRLALPTSSSSSNPDPTDSSTTEPPAVSNNVAPTTPTELSGQIKNDNNNTIVSLSWNAASDDNAVKGYNVYENGSYTATVFSTQYSGNVQPNTNYSYYIVAFDFDGNFATRTSRLILSGDEETQQAQNIEDTQVPVAPSNLQGTWNANGSTAEVSLTWNAATDNVGIAGYNVYEDKRYVTTVQTTSFSTTVDSSQNYSYQVVAFDIARNFSPRSLSKSLPNNENRAPTFENLVDQVAFVGDDIDIVIKPVDNDGETPGLFIGNLPTGMYSVDNFNGTKSVRWEPLQPDVGSYEIPVTAIDARDPSLTTVDSFTLTLDLPEDQSGIRNATPGINAIADQIVRIGDTVFMSVKATDANGTAPNLSILNLPDNASFNTDPEEPNIKILRWTTSQQYAGINTFNFMATDSVDPNLTTTSEVIINVVEANQFNRDGERLKTLAQRKDKLIGYASTLNFHKRPDSDLYKATAAQEFNLVTAENSMKWAYINPEPGQYRFDAADALAGFAASNSMKLHGHTLVWYAALPQWVQNSNVDEREGIMNDFIDTMTSRYNTVDIWDVVNEAFEDDGQYRNSVWFQAMGKDHIDKAFRRARAGAPNATLIYNDYDIAAGGDKTDATFALMERLLGNNAPLDGIGFQMHIDADFRDFDSIRNTFNRFSNLGLDIFITELDVSIIDGTNESDQATVFANVMQICLDHSACKALQVWGFTDRYSWLRNNAPLLFDTEYQPKPAYWSVQDVLDN